MGWRDVTDGTLMLLAQPRTLGHVFNPVSFWLAHDKQRRLRAVISEVSNTFGDRHSYLCAHDDHRPITREDTLSAQKIFHVSPFQPIEGATPSASTFARIGSASGSTTARGTRGYTPRSPASARR
jgi:DUF1365 family protein